MKRSPLGLDLYLWLTYRLFGLTEPCKLTWRQLYRQFGVNPARADKRTVDAFRTDVLRELGKLKDAWLGFDYSTPKGCLRAAPDPAAHRSQPSRCRKSSARRHGPHAAAPARVPRPRRAPGVC